MQTRRIALLLDRDMRQTFDYTLPPEEALASIGKNSGNIAFEYVLQRMVEFGAGKTNVDVVPMKAIKNDSV